MATLRERRDVVDSDCVGRKEKDFCLELCVVEEEVGLALLVREADFWVITTSVSFLIVAVVGRNSTEVVELVHWRNGKLLSLYS